MMKNICYHNGKALNQPIALKQFDPAGAGIFETFRVYNGKIFRLDEHLKRLQESAQTAIPSVFFTTPQGKGGVRKQTLWVEGVRREILAAVKGYMHREAVGRVTWTQAGLIVMMGQRKPPAELYQQGISLQTSPVRRSLSHAAAPEAKTTDYMNALMATLEPKPATVYEWVFLDQLGYVTEVRIGNLFIVDRAGSKRRLRTPPLHGILNGVTRRFVIECALLEGFEIREEPLTRHEIYTAEEAFLTNTSWEILPVRSLDARLVGQQLPGPVTQRLHKIFRKRVLQECPPLKSKEH